METSADIERREAADAEAAVGSIPPAATTPIEQERRARRAFPHPLTILLIVMLLVWVAVLFVPSGQYEVDDEGYPIAGSFQQIESPLTFPERVGDLLLAPINGLYGVVDEDTGQIGPFNSGAMFGAVQVFVFILTIGGFMTVVFATGALDLGIAHLAHRFRASGTALIVALSVLFALLGSVMSWSDETLGMYPLIIPLMLALGYDRMVALAVVFVAPSAGIIGSTVNPFKIGIGSDAADISLGDGIGLRLLLLVLVTGAMIVYTVRYANRVRQTPARSLVPITPEDDGAVRRDGAVGVPRRRGVGRQRARHADPCAARRFCRRRSRARRHGVQRDRQLDRQCAADKRDTDGRARHRVRRLQPVPEVHDAVDGHLARDPARGVRDRSALGRHRRRTTSFPAIRLLRRESPRLAATTSPAS